MPRSEEKFENNAEVPEKALDELLRNARSRLKRALDQIRHPRARVAVIDSTIGALLIAQSTRGLLALLRSSL